MNQLLAGAIAMACLVAGLFFMRFWRQTRDRFFLFFSVFFVVEAINRVILGLSGNSDEHEPLIYLIRFLAFVLIMAAIVEKNRKKGQQKPGAQGLQRAARALNGPR